MVAGGGFMKFRCGRVRAKIFCQAQHIFGLALLSVGYIFPFH